MGQLVNSEKPSDQAIKPDGGSKAENEVFITEE